MNHFTFSTTNFENILLAITIALMLVFPTQLMPIKLILFCILGINCLVRKKIHFLKKEIRPIYALIYLYGMWGVFTGLLKVSDNTEIFQRIPLLFIHPILFMLLMPYLKNNMNKLENLIVLCHCLLLCINFYNILASVYGFPIFSLSEDDVYFLGEDSVGIGAKNLHQMIFTIPFVFTIGYAGKRMWFLPVWIFTIILVAASTRGALIVVTILSMMIPLILAVLVNKNRKQTFVFYSIGVCLILALFFFMMSSDYFDYVYNDFISHFDETEDYNRYNQRKVLIEAWNSSPITGVGWGTGITTGYAGTITSFESTYHAILAYTGIIGLFLFLSYLLLTILLVYRKFIRTRSLVVFACLSGLICCIICASTNPVLSTFDRLLSLYLNVALLSCVFYEGSYHKI